MVTVKYDDLSMAVDFVSAAAPFEHCAYISRETGAIFWISEEEAIEQDELPDDLETSDQYIEIPHKHDLDLGNQLVRRFVEEHLSQHRDTVADIFRRRGAYARFKDLLVREGRLEMWPDYEARATYEALLDWCKEYDFQLDRLQA